MRHTRPESAYYMRPTLQEDARPPSGVLGGPFRACGRTPIYGTHQDNANHFEVLQDLDTYLGLEFQAIVQGLNWGVVRAEPAPSMPFRGDFLGAADCNWFLDGTGCTRDGGHASLVNADPLTLEPQRQRGFGAGHSHPKDTSRGHSAAPQLQPLETAGGLYEDPEFPATKAVLGHTVDGPCEVVWARPEQFGAAPPALFSTASADEPLVAPSDIVQGIVGDCWLLCAVSVLAEDPALIRGMFRSSDADLRQGFACVRLHVDGAVQDVVVDTRFPVFHGSQGVTPCFARARGPELWVMVLEKAYAKALGHFELLNNGDPGDALADLTGAPVYAFPANGPNPDALWKRLVDGKREGFFFCASVPEDPDRDTEQTVGIVEDHAYAILDIREVADPQRAGARCRLLCLRNPWGEVEWKGAWSDAWAGWTEDLKRDLGYHNAQDGLFWMAVEDFAKYFSDVHMLALRPGWASEYTRGVIPLRSPVPQVAYGFEVPAATSLVVTLHQPRRTGGPGAVAVRFCVLRRSDLVPMGGSSKTFQMSATLSCDQMDLDAGAYVLLLQAFPSTDAARLPAAFTVQTSASRPVPVEPVSPVPAEVQFILPEFLQSYGVCGQCGGVLGEACVTALGKRWHPGCWRCVRCAGDLQGTWYVHGNRPLCGRCNAGDNGHCKGCQKAIDGPFVQALGGQWHKPCLKCTACREVIAGPFKVKTNKPFCKECAK